LMQKPSEAVLLQVRARGCYVKRLHLSTGKLPRDCASMRPTQTHTDSASLVAIPLHFPDRRPHVFVQAFGATWDALLDTGATSTFVNKEFVAVLQQHQVSPLPMPQVFTRMANSEAVP